MKTTKLATLEMGEFSKEAILFPKSKWFSQKEKLMIVSYLHIYTDFTICSGTLGLCLNGCSVPGSGPLFEVAEDEMEIGLGM